MAHALSNDPVFKALADGTRREILEVLANGPAPVHVICSRFPVSRPAISKHLRVLGDAGLVSARRSGKEMLYDIEPAALGEVRDWLDRFWTSKLSALKRLAEGDA